MPLQTAVVLIIFNRPDTTEQVFQTIRQAQPKKLMVIADGPRSDRPSEAEKCAAARAIIDRVDWDCEVLKNYSDTNLGCGIRIAGGLDWVFSLVEEAIVLEDDCLPDLSFFSYCQHLLEYYRDDSRVMQIGGNNFQGNIHRTNYSYYFSRYNHSWGWASWRRAWKYFDFKLRSWPEFRDAGGMISILEDPYEQKYWTDIFQSMFMEQDASVWDYMWTYACWSQNGLSIIPASNLVSNLGFRADATHTNGNSILSNLPCESISQISHPSFILRHREADQYTFDTVFGGYAAKAAEKPLSRIKQIARSAKHRILVSSKYNRSQSSEIYP